MPNQGRTRSETYLPEVPALSPLDPAHPSLARRGVLPATAAAFGCGYFSGPRPMAGRIAFPIHDGGGRLVGHVGRAARDGQEPRYLASRGLPKGQLLYNAHRLTGDTVIVVEGPFDALAVYQAGAPNVVALLGCRATEAQLALLARLACVRVLLDADEAGREGAAFLVGALSGVLEVEVITLHTGDPASMPSDDLRVLLACASKLVLR